MQGDKHEKVGYRSEIVCLTSIQTALKAKGISYDMVKMQNRPRSWKPWVETVTELNTLISTGGANTATTTDTQAN